MLYVIPALGACLSCVDLVVLLRTYPRRDFIPCFVPLSRFAMWVSLCLHLFLFLSTMFPPSSLLLSVSTLQLAVMLSSKLSCACCVFTSRILCFWWIFRFLMEAFHLNAIFTLQVIQTLCLSLVTTI